MAKGKKMARVEAVLAPDIRRQRGDVIFSERVELDSTGRVVGSTRGDIVQDWLGRHHKAGDIDDQQHKAGKRLQLDAEQTECPIQSLLNPMRVGRGADPHAALMDLGYIARQALTRFRGALAACGPCRGVIEVVVIWGHSARHWARLAGRPDRDGIAALRLGLDGLVNYYRLDD